MVLHADYYLHSTYLVFYVSITFKIAFFYMYIKSISNCLHISHEGNIYVITHCPGKKKEWEGTVKINLEVWFTFLLFIIMDTILCSCLSIGYYAGHIFN